MMGILLVFLLTTLSNMNPMSIAVYPRISTAPSTIEVTVIVEPNEANRSLLISVDGGNYYASSATDVDGEYARKINTRRFKDLPEGDYTATATLIRNDSSKRFAAITFVVN